MGKSCPKCGGELPAGVTVCANCGADANEKPAVDNSAEISKMFGKDASIVVSSDELNANQLEAFDSGVEIEFSGSELDGALSAMNEINFDEILGENHNNKTEVVELTTAIPDDEEAEPHNDDDHDDIIIQKGVTEVHGFRLPRFVQNIIAFIIILALGFGLGYGLKYFQERGVFANYTNDISLKSLRAVNARAVPADLGFTAVEIFVKRDAVTTECIVFGVLSAGAGDYAPSYYRLIINNSDHSDTTLYLPFDSVRHAELLASGDVQNSLDAVTMMNRYETYLLSLAEINSDNPRWERADIEFVNKQLAREG
ncbi:MAG: zinc ribbon domain-containing protein [Oscillospiraceae bacterium]|nr:zinc ribbon domain-containing protein [Oscillospiraceae bacterium]